MKQFILSLALLLTASADAKTIFIPVNEIMMEIPNFDNAPRFNLNNSFYGNSPIENAQTTKRKSRKQREQELLGFMWTQYPDAQSINIYNENLVIRISDK